MHPTSEPLAASSIHRLEARVRRARAAAVVTGLLGTACLAPRSTGEPHTDRAPFRADGAAAGAEARAVHYLDAGLGERALVLVHGWASDTNAWAHQFPDLADLGRVLVVDLPGHGESDPPAEGYSMGVFADAIAAVLDHAGVEGAVLVGHSNGVPAILSFYRRHPERTLGLVGIDGALRDVFGDEQAARAMFAPFAGDGWRDAMAGMIDGMPAPNLSELDRATIRTMALNTRHEAVVGGFEATLDPAAWSEEPIDVPLLLIQTRSPQWDSGYEAFVRELSPGVDYRVWFDVGHYVQMERPAELREAIEGFVEEYGLLVE